MVVWREGRGQLECRIRLIDAVLNIGFNVDCFFSVRVYVPTVPTSTNKDAVCCRTLSVKRCVSPADFAEIDVQTIIGQMHNIMRREQIRPTTWRQVKLCFFWLQFYILYETRRRRTPNAGGESTNAATGTGNPRDEGSLPALVPATITYNLKVYGFD